MKMFLVAPIVLILIACIIWYLVKPDPWKPEGETYRRDIFLLIDQTPSISEEEFGLLKDLALKKIIKHLGPGDRLSCFSVDVEFTEADDLIFEAAGELPKLPDNYPVEETDPWPERARLDLARRWASFEPIRADWVEKITALELLPPTKSSDYFPAIEYLGGLMTTRCKAAECWLIVLGDLKHEPLSDLESMADDLATPSLFTGVKARLVSPYGTNSDAEQKKIEGAWEKFFPHPDDQDHLFNSLVGFSGLPETSAPRPESLAKNPTEPQGGP